MQKAAKCSAIFLQFHLKNKFETGLSTKNNKFINGEGKMGLVNLLNSVKGCKVKSLKFGPISKNF